MLSDYENSDSVNLGSNPSPPAKENPMSATEKQPITKAEAFVSRSPGAQNANGATHNNGHSEFAKSFTNSNWQKHVDPAKWYGQEEIARLLGVDVHDIACAMQVDIIRSKLRDNEWYAKGDDLLEWGEPAMLADEVFALFDLTHPSWNTEVAKPAPAPVQEPPPPLEPVIYFARCGEYIKIGFTRGKAQQRLKGLSTANPLPVELVATTPGGQDLERELHQRFNAFHWSGEWFVFSDPIREYIASLEG